MSSAAVETVVDVLRVLVAHDTTSSRSNLDLIGCVGDRLDAAGARLRHTYDPSGRKANLLAAFGPDTTGGVVLSAHTDVVPVDGQRWSSDPFDLTERDDRLHGRGTADMKGFVAACVAAAPRWAGGGLRRPIRLALSYDEEVGCLGVPALIDDLVRHGPVPDCAIVGEPTGMRIAHRHRGYLGFRTTFAGRSAHSSDPSLGVNAIGAAARFVTSARGLASGGTSVSVNGIGGGTGINVVPAQCDLSWEIRPAADADLPTLRARADDLVADAAGPGCPARTEETVTIPPLRPQPHSPAVDLARLCGGSVPPADIPFGTEAGYFQAAGIPAAVCGPGSIDQAHRADEFLTRGQLDASVGFLHHLTRWATTAPERGGRRAR